MDMVDIPSDKCLQFATEIVYLPIKNDDFPWLLNLPEVLSISGWHVSRDQKTT